MNAAAPQSPARIFLIGYRGAGKSTVATLLAKQLSWDSVDADALLEERAGQTIQQLFGSEGEQGFRARESALLEELCRRDRCVVATGGGVVLRGGNRTLLKQSGLCVWLSADIQTLWRRIEADESTSKRRPALTIGGRAEVEQLVHIREPFYRKCADFVVDTVGKSPDDIALEIVQRLGGSSR